MGYQGYAHDAIPKVVNGVKGIFSVFILHHYGYCIISDVGKKTRSRYPPAEIQVAYKGI